MKCFPVVLVLLGGTLLALLERPLPAAAASPHRDRYGDPLPPGALARLGSARFRCPGRILDVAFSPDGRSLAVGCTELLLFDRATGKEVWRLPASDVPRTEVGFRDRNAAPHPVHGPAFLESRLFTSLCFSPDGKWLAAKTLAGILVCDAASGRLVRRIGPNPNFEIQRCAFRDRGRVILGVGRGKLYHWDRESGQQVRCVASPDFSRGYYALTPDGALLATDRDLLDTTNGRALRRLEDPITGDVAFNADGRFLTIQRPASRSNVLGTWDVASGKRRSHLAHGALTYGPGANAALSPDGNLLAWAGPIKESPREGQTLWEVALLGTRTGTAARSLEAPGMLRRGLALDGLLFAPDGKVVVGWWDSSLYLWDTASGKLLLREEQMCGPPQRVVLTPDGRTLLTSVREEKGLRVWNVDRGREMRQLPFHSDSPLETLALAPDGRIVAVGLQEPDVHLFDVAGRAPTQRLKMMGANDYPRHLLFRPDGRHLLAWSEEIVIWDLDAGKARRRYPLKCDALSTPTVAVDGCTLLAKGQMNAPTPCRLFDLTSGREWPVAQDLSGYARFSADGRWLATVDENRRTLFLVDGRSGRIHRSLHARVYPPGRYHPRWVPSQLSFVCVFSPDDRLLAVAERGDPLIRIFDVATGRERGRLHSDQGLITDLSFSADGRRLASGGFNTTALVWDVEAARPPVVVKRSERELEALWSDLASKEAPQAYDALWQLVESPVQAVALLHRRLHPAPLSDARRLTQLLGELDSNDFATRQRAHEELRRLGAVAEDALKKTLAGQPSPEVRRRVEELLRRLRSLRPERDLRAVEALEQIGSREAMMLLKELSGGQAGASLTRAARAALERSENAIGIQRPRPIR